jgi:hypothetical protein
MADVSAFLVGAGATLTAQVVLQVYVIPRVEVRKRREDRWEKAVVEFGDLLSGDLNRSEIRAVSDLFRYCVARHGDDRPLEERYAAVADSMWTYRQLVDGRLRILADRIIGLDAEAPALRRFASALHDYRAAAVALSLLVPTEWRPRPKKREGEAGDYQEAQELNGERQLAFGALLDATRDLGRHTPPRPTPLRRVRRIANRARRSVRRRAPK